MTHPNDKIQLIHATEAQGDYSGLTKREYFAAMAMQGLTSGNEDINRSDFINYRTERAVQMADALIEQLNKQP